MSLAISGYFVLSLTVSVISHIYKRVRVPIQRQTRGQWAEGPQYSIYTYYNMRYTAQQYRSISMQTEQRALVFGGISIIWTPEYFYFTNIKFVFPYDFCLYCRVARFVVALRLSSYVYSFVKWLCHYEIKICYEVWPVCSANAHSLLNKKNSASW